MGYFPNGTSGEIYESEYCSKCVHRNGPDGKSGCAVWFAHMMRNYDECNKKDSILHMLIPKNDEKLCNDRCLMFWPIARPTGGVPDEDMTEADRKYLAWRTEQALCGPVPKEGANDPFPKRKVG